jgi:hypothetical protein
LVLNTRSQIERLKSDGTFEVFCEVTLATSHNGTHLERIINRLAVAEIMKDS